jgi:hypothetical protein
VTSLIGAADFQDQVAQSGQPILVQSFANIFRGTPVNIDLTSLITPQMQTFAIYWVANLASVGSPVQVSVFSAFNSVTFLGPTNIADGSFTVGAVPVAYLGTDPSAALTLQVAVSSLGISPIGGVVIVVALASPPVQRVAPSSDLIGSGTFVGTAIPAGGSATMLAAAPSGTYYRIKALWAEPPNPGASAGAGMAVQDLLTVAAVWGWRADGTNTQNLFFGGLDIENTNGLKGANNSAGIWTMGVHYETWPI